MSRFSTRSAVSLIALSLTHTPLSQDCQSQLYTQTITIAQIGDPIEYPPSTLALKPSRQVNLHPLIYQYPGDLHYATQDPLTIDIAGKISGTVAASTTIYMDFNVSGAVPTAPLQLCRLNIQIVVTDPFVSDLVLLPSDGTVSLQPVSGVTVSCDPMSHAASGTNIDSSCKFLGSGSTSYGLYTLPIDANVSDGTSSQIVTFTVHLVLMPPGVTQPVRYEADKLVLPMPPVLSPSTLQPINFVSYTGFVVVDPNSGLIRQSKDTPTVVSGPILTGYDLVFADGETRSINVTTPFTVLYPSAVKLYEGLDFVIQPYLRNITASISIDPSASCSPQLVSVSYLDIFLGNLSLHHSPPISLLLSPHFRPSTLKRARSLEIVQYHF